MFVYADNAATTGVSKTALGAMLPFLTDAWGNPSSVYGFGQRAREAVEQARQTVADCLGAESAKEIYFTSGGTESDNQALISCARAGARKGKKHLVSTRFEHHAVLRTLRALEKEGFELTLLDVHDDGVVRPEEAEAAIRPDTCCVSVMAANNEIGTIQPIAELGALCRERGIPFHTDAVQAVGRIPLHVEQMRIDMLSLSGHKFHAPKGVGALYCRRGTPLYRFLEGGAQEFGKRPGTENVAGIAALAAALKESCDNMEANAARVSAMRARLEAGLTQIPHSRLNGNPGCRLPGTVNLCFEGVEGESLLLALDREGICASSGSACNSGSLDPSHVLLSLGIPYALARGSLRLSIGEDNSPEEIDHILKTVPEAVAQLRSLSPVWAELEAGKRPHLC